MSTVPTTTTTTSTFPRLRPTGGVVRASLRLNARRFGWSLALVLLTGAEWLTVPFWSDPVASNDWISRACSITKSMTTRVRGGRFRRDG